jgi:hypothetical protein
LNETSKALAEAKKLLGALKSQYPWRFDNVQSQYPGLVVGAIRTKDGRNVVQPHPESSSMIVSFPETIEFLVAAPRVMAALIKELEVHEEMHSKPEGLDNYDTVEEVKPQGRRRVSTEA